MLVLVAPVVGVQVSAMLVPVATADRSVTGAGMVVANASFEYTLAPERSLAVMT